MKHRHKLSLCWGLLHGRCHLLFNLSFSRWLTCLWLLLGSPTNPPITFNGRHQLLERGFAQLCHSNPPSSCLATFLPYFFLHNLRWNSVCIGCFSCGCDQTSNKQQLKGERVCFVLQFEGFMKGKRRDHKWLHGGTVYSLTSSPHHNLVGQETNRK